MTLDITQFYQTFFDEADELLAQMEQLLLNLNVGQPDPEDLAAIFRAAHSIKGGAATFGFTALTETTHILESLLDRARNNELVLRKDMIDTFLETKDVLSGQLADYRASQEPDAAVAAAICAKLERLNAENRFGGEAAAAPAAAAPAAPTIAQTAPAADGTPPDHVIDQAVDAANARHGIDSTAASATPATPASSGAADAAGPHLKVTLRGVGEKDEALLAEELGNLGQIVGQVKSGNDLTLWLETDVPSDDIVAVLCFVIDESQISVGRGSAPAGDEQPAQAAAATQAAEAAPVQAAVVPAAAAAAQPAAAQPAAAPVPVAAPAAGAAGNGHAASAA
ncbi:Hpt domain-containing protein, partial [Paraburkholderia solisilvae]